MIWAFIFFGKHCELNKNMRGNLCRTHGEVRNAYRSSVVKMKMKRAIGIAGIDERISKYRYVSTDIGSA